jgi:hypothetical protein
MLTHAVTPRAFLFSWVRIQHAPADAPAPPNANEVKDAVVKATAAPNADGQLPSLASYLGDGVGDGDGDGDGAATCFASVECLITKLGTASWNGLSTCMSTLLFK